MDTRQAPFTVTLAAGAVKNITSEVLDQFGTSMSGVKVIQVDLPSTFAGAVHPWFQPVSRANPSVADVRKMTRYKYVDNNPLQFAVDQDTELILVTDSGTAVSVDVMVTLWF